MTQGWKEVAKAFAFVLLFGIIAWNLYAGAGLFIAIFRGVVAFLVFQILNIALTNLVVRTLNQYEYKRLREIAAEEEREELRMAMESAEDDTTYETEPAKKPGAAQKPSARPASTPSSETQNAPNSEPKTAPAEAQESTAAGEPE